jgi:hypothetical protein
MWVEQKDHKFWADNLGCQWTTGLLYRSTELSSWEKEEAAAFVPMYLWTAMTISIFRSF